MVRRRKVRQLRNCAAVEKQQTNIFSFRVLLDVMIERGIKLWNVDKEIKLQGIHDWNIFAKFLIKIIFWVISN